MLQITTWKNLQSHFVNIQHIHVNYRLHMDVHHVYAGMELILVNVWHSLLNILEQKELFTAKFHEIQIASNSVARYK